MIYMQDLITKIILSSFFSFPILGHCQGIDYEVKYDPFTEVRLVPLSFETNKNKVYLSPYWGLHILDVECDNKKVVIEDSDVEINEQHRFVSVTEGKHYTYIIPLTERVFFAVDMGKSYDDYKMKRIIFPKQWNRIKIKYKIRFADGTFSRDYTALFSRVWPAEQPERVRPSNATKPTESKPASSGTMNPNTPKPKPK